ncbi:hypothetical protein C2S51_006824 [Perilla frutescens var. frutescens]|nr:hypothetical protein C2S51_006824 [Perilla frutescens var. frutescens]
MAAAYAALLSLINNIHQMMNHPRLSTSLHNNHIQPLLEKAAVLLDFIETNKYGGSDVEREIASAAHAAEDVIESHIVDQIRAGSNQSSRRCTLDLQLQQIIEDMDAIMEKIMEAKEGPELREEQPSTTSLTEFGAGESSSTGMVGLDAELIQLMDYLTGHQSSRLTISIIGMGGMGKTTLAKTVYKNLLIMHHFDIRAWATVSQRYNVIEILSQLAFGQGKSSNETPISVLGEQLHKTLSGRRYLIILDDVWSVDVWDEVRRFLPDNGNGSRVVLTTRLSNVAIDCGSSCFNKNLLNENESWELFCKKAFQHQDCPTELEEVGKEIVKLCKGLPLSIVVIGGRLFKSPRTVGYWEYVANEIKSIPNSKEKQESLDVLFSSYNHLPTHLKPCFLYTGVFKRGSSEIHTSKIIKLWIAEGFLKSNGTQVLEEIAEEYLKDLIDRNLILTGRRHDNGKIKSCDIHDLLRDLCLKVSEQQEFVRATEHGIQGTERRFILASSMSGTGLPLARSIMPFKVCEQELDKNKLLRILDVVRCGSTEELFGCVNLRYLALDQPDFSTASGSRLVWELPSSISLAWNLQTLTIKPYFLMVSAPMEFWKMRQLRHVECRYIYLSDPRSSGQDDELLIMEDLQTLKTAVNLRLSEEVCKIIPNIKKLHLVHYHQFQGYDDCLTECLCNLSRLHKLESLRLSATLNKILKFPNSIKKLTLSYCGFHWDDLTMIGSLPQLEVLKLEIRSVMEGKQWSSVNGQFLHLKFLKIESCVLVCWDADSSHFPVLEKLVLRNLPKLEEIPWGIGEVPTLKFICVERCSEYAAISAVKIKVDQLDTQANDDLQIQLKMSHYDMESFREMVEREGLSMDNIQLEIF